MVDGYDEARVLFDPYPGVDHTLKDKTQQSRSNIDEGFDVYMNMPLAMSVNPLSTGGMFHSRLIFSLIMTT